MKMFFQFFDPNQTVRHVSYKELKRLHKEQMQRTDRFFEIVTRVALYGASVLILSFLIARIGI